MTIAQMLQMLWHTFRKFDFIYFNVECRS